MTAPAGEGPGTGRRRNIEREETRVLLLETATRILQERGLPEALNIRVAEVVAVAGRTTGSAYQIWASQDEFQRDLVRHMAENLDWDEPRRIADGLTGLDLVDPTFEDLVGAMGRAYFENYMGQNRFYVSLQFWSIVDPSPELAAAIRTGYKVVVDGFQEILETVFAMYERRVKEPFVIGDVCNALMATADGHTLRKKFDADVFRRTDDNYHAFSAALLAIATYYTEPIPASDD